MDFMQAVADGNAEHVKKALAGMSPWEVNKPRRNKSTALMVAASLGNFDITRMLIDAEAALDVQDTDEQTALMYAICGQNEDGGDALTGSRCAGGHRKLAGLRLRNTLWHARHRQDDARSRRGCEPPG